MSENQEEMLQEFQLVLQECYGDNITMADLRSLKPLFVTSIYLRFVQSTLRASVDNMKMIGINAPEAMRAHPEVYEKAILIPRAAKLLAWFFSSIYEVDDFSISDILFPKPDRTRRFFSFIVSFIIAQTDVLERLDLVKQEVAEKKALKEATEAEIKNKTAKISSLRKKLTEIQIQHGEEMKEADVLRKEIEAIQLQTARIKGLLETAKSANEDCNNERKTRLAKTEEVKEKIESLKREVVEAEEADSVRERLSGLEEMKQEIEAKKIQLLGLEAAVSEENKYIATFSEVINPCVADIDSCVQQRLAAEEEIKEKTNKFRQIEATLSENQHNAGLLQKKEIMLEENRRALKDQFSRKRQGILSDISAKEQMVDALSNSDQNRKQQEKELSEGIQKLQHQISDSKSNFTAYSNFYGDAYNKLNLAVEQHNLKTEESLQRLLEKVNPAH